MGAFLFAVSQQYEAFFEINLVRNGDYQIAENYFLLRGVPADFFKRIFNSEHI